MTWKFTGKNKHGDATEPLPGLPLESSEHDFNDALRQVYGDANGTEARAVKASGLYEHVSDKPAESAEG